MKSLIPILICFLFFGCGDSPLPKPRGYYKISFPEKKYRQYNAVCPFSFEFPLYANIIPDSSKNSEECWLNIDFPEYKGRLHISYKPLQNNLNLFLEDSRKLAYKHSVKADAINEIKIEGSGKVHGMYYDIQGNTASAIQFVLTDSSKHFLRGSLYFYNRPNIDSIAPVISFIQKDIDHLINTFQWK